MSIRLPKPWVLVLVGLVLNVMAIIMSSIVLDKLGNEVSALDSQKEANLYSIQLAWNTVEALERKREMVLLHAQLSQLTEPSEVLQLAIQDQVEDWLGTRAAALSDQDMLTVLKKIDEAQREYKNYIDDYYLENLSVSEVVAKLNDRVAWYKNIALFLQVFGLALILARDLVRRD